MILFSFILQASGDRANAMVMVSGLIRMVISTEESSRITCVTERESWNIMTVELSKELGKRVANVVEAP
jgi:hypothetical protein